MISIIHKTKELLEHLVAQCTRVLDDEKVAAAVLTYGTLAVVLVFAVLVWR